MTSTLDRGAVTGLGMAPVTFEDRELVTRYTRDFDLQSCMYNFLHIFTRTRSYRFLRREEGGRLYLYNSHLDKLYYPLGAPMSAAELARTARQLGASAIHFAPERYIDATPDLADHFEVTTLPAEDEYIYDNQAIAEMAGGLYSRKRESVSKFKRTYPDHAFRVLGEADADDCLALTETWRQQKGSNASIDYEFESIQLALSQFDALGLSGLGLYVEGRLVAYDIFSGGVGTLASCSYEKYDRDIRDCVPALRQAIGKHLLEAGFTHMNFARDIDDDGLRASKSSYHPAYKLRQFILTLKALP
ncbi:MAG: hypothetical protein JWM80_4842 [Cyanobacteria bacterium RYN_339]|nr:hypothetical protein [Cyanobacteria bacterium RYN_339]